MTQSLNNTKSNGRHEAYSKTALVLRGGGALGACQAGVYEALSEADVEINWVAGISIGAINAAIIAGYPPERRVDSTCFGDYTESSQIIPVLYRGHKGGYSHAMYLNDEPPILGGRELWGFPKTYAQPAPGVHRHTLAGTLDYGPVRVAAGTMGFKHREADKAEVLKSLQAANYLLKIVPYVEGAPRVCELVGNQIEDIDPKGAWSGPAALDLRARALAPVADLPVLEVNSTVHLVADPTLGLGVVEHDYLATSHQSAHRQAAE